MPTLEAITAWINANRPLVVTLAKIAAIVGVVGGVLVAVGAVADVPGIDQDKFMAYAKRAKAECPVSKALAAVNTVKLSAVLTSGS